MNKLLEIHVPEHNRYATQKGLNFETTENELMSFLGINSILVILEIKRFKKSW